MCLRGKCGYYFYGIATAIALRSFGKLLLDLRSNIFDPPKRFEEVVTGLYAKVWRNITDFAGGGQYEDLHRFAPDVFAQFSDDLVAIEVRHT